MMVKLRRAPSEHTQPDRAALQRHKQAWEELGLASAPLSRSASEVPAQTPDTSRVSHSLESSPTPKTAERAEARDSERQRPARNNEILLQSQTYAALKATHSLPVKLKSSLQPYPSLTTAQTILVSEAKELGRFLATLPRYEPLRQQSLSPRLFPAAESGRLATDHKLQRQTLLLRLPVHRAVGEILLSYEVNEHQKCIAVLPSEQPSTRREALAVERLVAEMTDNPINAAARASEWRVTTLQEHCKSSLLNLADIDGPVEAAGGWAMLNRRMVREGSQQLMMSLRSQRSGGKQELHIQESVVKDLLAASPTLLAPQRSVRQHQDSGNTLAEPVNMLAAYLTFSALRRNLPESEAGACCEALALGATIAMADLVRQVEVHCIERGRALALVWNLYAASTTISSELYAEQVEELRSANATLNAHAEQLQHSLISSNEQLDFLRREIVRFRKESAAFEGQEVLSKEEETAGIQARSAVKQADAHIRKRLAVLRWRYAYAAVLTNMSGKQRLGGGRQLLNSSPGSLLDQLRVFEMSATAAAFAQVNKQLVRKGGGQQDGEGSMAGTAIASIIEQVYADGMDLSRAWLKKPDKAVAALEGLTLEARAAVLLSLDSNDRQCLVASMDEGEVAEIICILEHTTRAAFLEELAVHNATLAACAPATIWANPDLNVAWVLGSAHPPTEFVGLSESQQIDVLTHAQPHQAAGLLQELSTAITLELLMAVRIKTAKSAEILAAMPVSLAQELLLGAPLNFAFAVLLAMPTSTAQQTLAYLAVQQAAAFLQPMTSVDQERIIPFLPPAVAAKLKQFSSTAAESASGSQGLLRSPSAAAPAEEQADGSQQTSAEHQLQILSSGVSVDVLQGTLTRTEDITAKVPAGGSSIQPHTTADGVTAVSEDTETATSREEEHSGTMAKPLQRKKSVLVAVDNPASVKGTLSGTKAKEHRSRKSVMMAEPAPPAGKEEAPSTAGRASNRRNSVMLTAGETSIRNEATSDTPAKDARRRKSVKIAAKPTSHVEADDTVSSQSRLAAKREAGQPKPNTGAVEAVFDAEQASGQQDTAAIVPGDGLLPLAPSAGDEQHFEVVQQRARRRASVTAVQHTLHSGRRTTSSVAGGEEDTESTAPPTVQPKRARKSILVQAGLRPKNARLMEAIRQNLDARVRTPAWLMGVIEEIYADIEARHRRTEGALPLLGGATMPEVAFSHFHQKFGSRSIVDEYIGSLNNTLLASEKDDVRLAVFHAFLTEEWEMVTILSMLQARALLTQVPSVTCIQYQAREPARGDGTTWLCLAKAVWIADCCLGKRSAAVRDRFGEILRLHSVQAEEADMQWASVPENLQGAAAMSQPSARASMFRSLAIAGWLKHTDYWKLPRDAFLQLLCQEHSRLDKIVSDLALRTVEGFMPSRSGALPAEDAAALLRKAFSSAVSLEPGSLEGLQAACAKAAGPDGLVATELLCTIAAQSAVLREALVKQHAQPALLMSNTVLRRHQNALLAAVVARHFAAMSPVWAPILHQHGSLYKGLQHEVTAVQSAPTDEAKVKAYINLVQLCLQRAVQSASDSAFQTQNPDDRQDSIIRVVEEKLDGLEDAVAVVMRAGSLVPKDPVICNALSQRHPISERGKELASASLLVALARKRQEHIAARIVQISWRQHLTNAAQRQVTL